MSPAHETQSMREIRLLRGRLQRKGGGLTGMGSYIRSWERPGHFAINISGNSPFGTPALMKNAERYEYK
jgi:hypothetical protein